MKTMTTRFLTIALSILFGGTLIAQTGNIAINNTGANPDAQAVLDVSSTTSGFLIPRMTLAQRNALTTVAGLTVYQTNSNASNPKGFWVWVNATAGWTHLVTGPDSWKLTGNAGTTPVTNFLGTTDNADLVFRTNNLVRGRVDANGTFKVGATAPTSSEALQVDGAIQILGANSTNDAGAIRWNATDQVHEGNTDGTATGWIPLENPYDVDKNNPFTKLGTITCAANSSAGIPTAWGSVSSATVQGASASPMVISNPPQRKRTQWLFRREELDLGLAQITDPTRTEGICANEPINSISLYLGGWTGAASSNFFIQVNIKHTSLSQFSAATGFDNSADPNGSCAQASAVGTAGNLGPFFNPTVGWNQFTFTTPFVWDGVSNIIIEFVMMQSAPAGISTLRYAGTVGLPFNATYGRYGALNSAPCIVAGTACAPSVYALQGGAMQNNCGAGGVATVRPIVRFNGTVSSAPLPTVSAGDYIYYDGSLMVDSTPGWNASGGTGFAAFQGPGTISAEKGVYSDDLRLNDHVFDNYFDGRVSQDDVFAFGDRKHYSIDEMIDFVASNRHLPTMKGRLDWERSNGFSLSDLTGQLWMTAEAQALYLTELNDKVKVLAMLSTEGPLSEVEFELLKQEVLNMTDLTDGDKHSLINQNETRVTRK